MKARCDAVVAAAIVVSDQTSLAVVGMDDRQFRELVKQRAIPHRVWKRHVFVRVADVLAALGLADAPGAPASAPRAVEEWDEQAVIERAARGGRRR